MTNTPLRTALIGPGRISVAHLDAITHDPSLATLVAVAGLPQEAERTEQLAGRFGAARAIHDVQALIDDDDIEAVVVTVPNHVHAEVAIPLLRSGKHVLIEKPLANTVAECRAIEEAAGSTGRTVMVGQCRRFFDGAKATRDLVEQLGRPLAIDHYLGVYVQEAATGWWRSASAAGGLAVGLNGPHVVDTMLWLIDSRPVRVYARTMRLRDKWEGEDEAFFIVDFEDGSVGSGHISLNASAPVNSRWINGPAGALHLLDDRTLTHNGNDVVREEVTPYIEGDVSFRGQFREFASAIRERRQARPSAAEGRSVVAILQAIQQSQETGQPVAI